MVLNLSCSNKSFMDCVIDLTNAFAVSNIEYLHICIFFQFIAQFILAGKTGGDDYTVSRNRCFITPSIGQNDIVFMDSGQAFASQDLYVCFIDRCKICLTSETKFARKASVISTIVTFLPSAFNSSAVSAPVMPPPITTTVFPVTAVEPFK